jgi:hypothetical protein
MDQPLESMHRDRFPVSVAVIIAALVGLGAWFVWPG